MENYKKIHFTLCGAENLTSILPGWPNSFSTISRSELALYHAYCVVGGNFPVLLWQQMSQGLEKLGIPNDKISIYLETVLKNFLQHRHQALTGPLQRRDFETIQKNLRALQNEPSEKIYRAFVESQNLTNLDLEVL